MRTLVEFILLRLITLLFNPLLIANWLDIDPPLILSFPTATLNSHLGGHIVLCYGRRAAL